eukprot:772377-Pyramimonas_sp.AAC.1
MHNGLGALHGRARDGALGCQLQTYILEHGTNRCHPLDEGFANALTRFNHRLKQIVDPQKLRQCWVGHSLALHDKAGDTMREARARAQALCEAPRGLEGQRHRVALIQHPLSSADLQF